MIETEIGVCLRCGEELSPHENDWGLCADCLALSRKMERERSLSYCPDCGFDYGVYAHYQNRGVCKTCWRKTKKYAFKPPQQIVQLSPLPGVSEITWNGYVAICPICGAGNIRYTRSRPPRAECHVCGAKPLEWIAVTDAEFQ